MREGEGEGEIQRVAVSLLFPLLFLPPLAHSSCFLPTQTISSLVDSVVALEVTQYGAWTAHDVVRIKVAPRNVNATRNHTHGPAATRVTVRRSVAVAHGPIRLKNRVNQAQSSGTEDRTPRSGGGVARKPT